MPFRDILGQSTAIETLTRSLSMGRVHHAYRFEGPDGVGRERVAIGLAQSLLCESPRSGLACLECGACRRVPVFAPQPPRSSMHPDLIIVGRGFYPPQLLGEKNPEVTGISIAQVRRVILARVGMGPHEGRALVFLIRDADELNAQSANALLKTLEEPAQRVHFILLTSRPNQLLDTIRSRTHAVRFAPLADDVLGQILERHGAPRSLIPMAQGSASLALQLSDSESLEHRERFVETMERAIQAPDLATGLMLLETKNADRTDLTTQLSWFAAHLARAVRGAVEAGNGAELLLAEQHAAVLGTLGDLRLNGPPALMLEALLTRLRRLAS